VGYKDAAFLRRLFKRTTGLAPGAYRKRCRIPAFARP
jgi:YesN/AraC family two-component response regulator